MAARFLMDTLTLGEVIFILNAPEFLRFLDCIHVCVSVCECVSVCYLMGYFKFWGDVNMKLSSEVAVEDTLKLKTKGSTIFIESFAKLFTATHSTFLFLLHALLAKLVPVNMSVISSESFSLAVIAVR